VVAEKAFILTGTKVLEGWLGVKGYPRPDIYQPMPIYNQYDTEDTYFFRLEKDLTIRLKLEYDASFKDNPGLAQSGGGDLGVRLAFYESDYSWPNNDWVPIANWSESGFVTEPITLPNSGSAIPTYGIIVQLGDDTPIGKPVGSYKLSIIVEGPEPEPKPEGMYVTLQEAGWTKISYENQIMHAVRIDYEVENTHNVTKTLESIAYFYAPLAKDVQGETHYRPRSELITSIIDIGSCQYDEIEWDQFCTGLSLNDGTCRYFAISSGGPAGGRPITLSAHSKKNLTEFIPVSTTLYYSLDDSLQIVGVALIDESMTQNYDCDTYGLSFLPVWSIVPALLPLLLGN